MSINIWRGVLGAAAVLISTGCGDLEVTNPNNPGIDRVLATPEDVANVAYGSLSGWYNAVTDVDGPLAMAVTADVLTANFGNFGMRFLNVEPRAQYVNNSAGGDRQVVQYPWGEWYSSLGAANDAAWALVHGGIVVPGGQVENDKVLAAAKFTQAANLTSLALMFDQAFVVDEDTVQAVVADPNYQVDLLPYPDVAAAALDKWDEVIALTAGQTWGFGANAGIIFPLNGAPLDAPIMNKWANTMAARLIAYTPRNAAMNAAADWAAVLSYARKGITDETGQGMSIVLDGDVGRNTGFISYYNRYGNFPSWVRVDHRVINMMAPNVPAKYDGTTVAPIPVDNRVGGLGSNKDFVFLGGVIGDPLRGIYMQSAYYHKRYNPYSWSANPSAAVPQPFILAQENNLLIAEALIRTGGSQATAASLINMSRVVRGGLPPATAADGAATLLEYIEYERTIELILTSAIELYDGRRFENLQPGTPRHFPIPARELETLGMDVYTFGGPNNPDMRIARRAQQPSFSMARPRAEGPVRPQQ